MGSYFFQRSSWYWDRRKERSTAQPNEDESKVIGSTAELTEDKSKEGGGEQENHPRVGIVVAIGWMLSTQKTLAAYTRLYKSYGWDCLVFHPHVLNL